MTLQTCYGYLDTLQLELHTVCCNSDVRISVMKLLGLGVLSVLIGTVAAGTIAASIDRVVISQSCVGNVCNATFRAYAIVDEPMNITFAAWLSRNPVSLVDMGFGCVDAVVTVELPHIYNYTVSAIGDLGISSTAYADVICDEDTVHLAVEGLTPWDM